MPSAVGQLYQEGYDDALANGADATKAHEAGLKNAPAAGLEFLGDKLIVGRILKPLKGKIKVKDVLKVATASAASEGATEGLQQVWQNFNASTLTGYDPERKVDDEIYHSALIGAIVGGTAAGAGRAGKLAIGYNEKVDALEKVGVKNPDEALVDRMNRSLAKQLNNLDAQKPQGREGNDLAPNREAGTARNLAEVLASARVQSDAQRAAIEAEQKAREGRLEAAKQRREAFEGYLAQARQLLGVDDPSPAAVKGVVTTLRAYVDDKSIELPLAQQNEALALIRDLKPIHEKLSAEENAAAAVRVAEAKAQAEREATERKARIREEKRALKEDDKQRIENLSDDALWALMESEDSRADAAEAELNRREKQQLTPITDEDDLLTVLRRIKLPTKDSGLQAELDLLKNEGVNFGTRTQLFDSKQGSLDRTAEKLRGEGFNQIQTPDDVIEFTKRALAGERILPQVQFDGARKARSDKGTTHAPDDRLPHDHSATDSPDPFTAHGTLITGSRVTAAQAIRIAARGREARLHLAQSDARGTQGMGQRQPRELGAILPIHRTNGGLTNTLTGQTLPQIGRGVEAYVYEDAEQGVVYKVYSEGTSSDRSIGMRVAIDGDGMAGLDTGQLPDIIEKTWAINDLGGTPTEIVGRTLDGEIVVKQPRGNDAAQYERAQVIAKAHLQEVPASVLPRIDMRSPLYYSHIAGQDVLLGDLHGKNFIGDTIGRGRINDLATHVLTAEELAKLPKLNAWLTERRANAHAQGSAEFAKRSAVAEGRATNGSTQSMAQVTDLRELVMTHNLTEANLLHAKKMGGLATPSFAITQGKPPENFGEITLIGSRELAQPKRDTQVFGADIYSPQYPSVELEIDRKAWLALNDKVGQKSRRALYPIPNLAERGAWGLAGDPALMAHFLEENGHSIPKENEGWAAGLRRQIEEAGLSEKHEAYVREELAKMTKGERIRQGSTAMGRPRYIPHTLENVVKILKKGLRSGTVFTGAGSIRAHLAPQFKTIDTIRKNKDRLVTREQVEALREEVNEELSQIIGQIISQSQGMESWVATQFIEDVAKNGIPRAAQAYNLTLDAAQQTRIREFLDKLRGMPTEYFEGKLLRAVQVGEFSAAVVPDTIGPEALQYLREQGIKDIRTYDPKEAGAQARTVGEYQHLFFAREQGVKQQQRQIQEQAKVLRAPHAEGRGGNDASQSMAALTERDFTRRIGRIAPALMLRYKALVGDYDSLFSVGVRPEQLDGSEQAAHIINGRKRILWFLQQNLRADKNGLMDERLRRDVLHEASHAWINAQDADRKAFLFREWQRDLKASDGWLAQMRRDKVELRKGVATDWQEYWAERLAYENNQWASRREHWAVIGDRGVLAQLYAEFRQFLADAIDLLQRAFTRTKRYNIDFRSFLTDTRYAVDSVHSHSLRGVVASASDIQPIPIAAAKAWHGSPHRGIEQEGFKLNKIGSGEGAQAYGWGIYFAGNKSISESYRKKLAVRSVDEIFSDLSRDTGRPEFLAELKGDKIPEKYRPFLRALVKEKWAGREGNPARVINHVLGKQFDRTTASPELLAEVDKLKREEMGQLYSADIPEAHELLDWEKSFAEQPPQVQEALRAIYRELGADEAKLQSLRGRDLYEGLKELALEKNPVPSTQAYEQAKADYAESEKRVAALSDPLEAAKQKALAAMERQMGLPELDASIKQAEDEVRRLWNEHSAQEDALYAILDENKKNLRNRDYWTPHRKQTEQAAIARLEELRLGFNDAQGRMKALRAQRPLLTGQIKDRLNASPDPEVVRARAAWSEAYRESEAIRKRKEQLGYEWQVEQAGYKKPIASELLLKHGVPGLRYLDGNSRGAGEGSHNYVIWDEARLNNDIQIYYARKAQKTREDIQRVIDAAKKPSGHAPEKADLGPVADWVVEAAAQKGFDIRGYKHTLDGSAVRHILKNHYDAKAETKRGQVALSDADLLAFPQLLETADKVVFGTKNKLHKDQIVYLKHMPDGSTLYLEEIRSGRGELAAVSARKYPATIGAESILSTLNPNVQDDSGNALTVVERPAEVKGELVQADFARAEDSSNMLSYEQRLARNLHELEEFNLAIEELKDATTRREKADYQRLLGERNEKRMFIDAEFSGWRKLHPQLADGQVLDAHATRKRVLEHDLKEVEEKAASGNTFAEKHAHALRRTLQREYPEGGNPVAQAAPTADAEMMRQIQSVIDAAKQPARHAPQKADLGPVANWVAEAVKNQLGIDVSDYRHVLDGSAVRHITKRHSNPKTEIKIGQVAITEADFKSIPQVVASPDRIILGEKTDQHKDAIIYIKRMPDGSILYIEEVRTGRGELASTSMRKYPAARDLSSITATVPSYAQSDGGILSPTVIDAPDSVKSASVDSNEGRSQAAALSLLGDTNVPPPPGQTLWQWLTGFIKGFRNFVPEVSVRDQSYAPLRQFYKAIKRATPKNQHKVQMVLGRIAKPLLDLGMTKDTADLYRKLGLIKQRIRKLEKAGEGKPDVQAKNAKEIARLHSQAAQLNAQLEAQPYHLFNKIVLAEDYLWRVDNLTDEKTGQPLALPEGLSREAVQAERDRLLALAAAHPHAAAINRAVQAHLELVAGTWAELERRFPELKAVPQNPYYFPHHIINDKHPAKLARVRLDTAAELRKYLIEPKGSIAPIETDYVKAMALHLSAVYAHNTRADLTRDLIKNQYDLLPELRERAKELSEERGERVSWQGVFNEDYKHSGYVRWTPDDRLHLHSAAVVDREKLSKRIGVALGDGDLQEELKKAGITELQLLPTDIREALTPTAKEEWVIPKKVAQALEAMIDRESRFEGSDLGSGLARSLEAAQNLWKRHILFSPWNYIRYEYNNTTSDIEKLFSADPEVFKHLPSALREVMALFAPNAEGRGGNDASQTMAAAPSRDARIAFALGVMNSVTLNEINQLPQLHQFAALKARPDRLRDIAKAATTLFMAGGRSTVELSQLREATFRYAKFKADLDRMRNGARPVYAGAYHEDIEALKVTEDHLNTINAIVGADSARSQDGGSLVGSPSTAITAQTHTPTNAVDYVKAAEISLATFGDYDTISVSGQALRKMMIPFYSWIEINFRYHANLFRNLRDMALAGEMSQAEARKAGARAAGVLAATFTRRVAALTAGRLLLPYLAIALWNNSEDNEEIEKDLSPADRRRFHIVLGRDSDGRARVVYAATALGDIMKWFGGDDMMRLAADLATGRTTLAKAVEDYSQKFLPDLVNNLAGGIGPVVKAGYTWFSGKDPFPDITDQRTIPAYDLKWNILSQMTDGFTADMIRRVLDKDYLAPRDLGDWAQQLILQVRKRDAASYSFYAIKDKAAEWNERRTGKSRGQSDYNSPEMQVLRNYRRAIYKGDVANAMRFYDRLLEFGYTAERLRSSIRSQDPLSEIPKELRRQFVASLSPFERRQLERAYIHYAKMNSLRGYEAQLFPSRNTPPAWRQRHKPRYNILERQITGHRQLTGEELARRAHRAMMESLR